MFGYGYTIVSRENGQTRLNRDIFLSKCFLARLGKKHGSVFNLQRQIFPCQSKSSVKPKGCYSPLKVDR